MLLEQYSVLSEIMLLTIAYLISIVLSMTPHVEGKSGF